MNEKADCDFSLVTGLILAGGRATRMNNLDKGLQLLDGQSLVKHVIARLHPQVGTLALNANRNLDDYARLGLPVWQDRASSDASGNVHEFKGPLAGVEIGLIQCLTPYLLIVPCDCPFLPADLTARFMAKINNSDIAVACSGDPTAPRLQPVFCLMKVSILEKLQHYLSSGGRKMDGWYGNASVVKVYFPDESAFRNINTPEDLIAASMPAARLITPTI